MDLAENKVYTYFNGTLTGPVNQVFEDFINNEVYRPSYAKRKRPSHFALRKRKGYKKLTIGTTSVTNFGVNDIGFVNSDACGNNNDRVFLYMLSSDGTQYQIWHQPSNCSSPATMITSGNTCTCGYNGFLEVEYAKGRPRTVSSNGFTGGVQSNAVANNRSFGAGVPVQGRLSVNDGTLRDINFGTGSQQVQIGDYVVVRTAPLHTSGQAKRVTGYDATNKELILDTPWTFPTGTTTEANTTVSIYPTRGPTLIFNDASGPRVLNIDFFTGSQNESVLPLQIIQNKCISSMSVISGIWNFLTTEGFVVFGGANLNSAYFSGSEFLGTEYSNIIQFRGYNIFTSDTSLKAGIITVGSTNYTQNLRTLTNDTGIWSRDAHIQFKNSLYILGSNKRLYAASVSSGSSTNFEPQIQLENMSEQIVGELDLLTPGDEVSLYADEKNIKIFIRNGSNCKILIYESDYGFWHKHIIKGFGITGYKRGFYMGDGLYKYCGFTDGPIDKQTFYDQKISVILGENEPNGMSFNSFQDKKLDFIKLNIGPSILNEGSSMVEIESHRNGYKSHIEYGNWNKIPRIKKYNEVFSGQTATVDCTDTGLDCDKIENKYINGPKDETYGAQSDLAIQEQCQCPIEYREKSDFVDGYDSKSYFLSDSYNVMISTQELRQASLFRITFSSSQGDRMWFNGFFAGVLPGALEDMDGDGGDILQSECYNC